MPSVVRASTKGQVVIPAELRKELGIRPGTRLGVRAVAGTIVLTPLGDDPIAAGLGMLKGEDSLTQALLEERAAELEREEREVEQWMHR
jgi:AbrB family looped-hinge helix DNA binding protein